MSYNPFVRPLECAREAIRSTVAFGDTVIDATAGNGYDTCFLAELVGEQGIVHSFDIQQMAYEATQERLKSLHLYDKRVILHLCSHGEMSNMVQQPVSAIMFNLGYLPKGDHSCVTSADETLKALQSSCNLLKPEGLISVMCYLGHPGGKEEAHVVSQFFSELDIKHWLVSKVSSLNGSSEAPFLILAQKRM